MSTHPVTLKVAVGVPESWAQILYFASLQPKIEREVQTVLDILGIPAKPQVQLTNTQPSTAVDPLLKVSVQDHPCFYVSDILHQAYGYVSGRPIDVTVPPRNLLSALTEQTPEQLGQFVCLVSGEIIKRQPAVLLTADTLKVYAATLINDFDENLTIGHDWLHPLLVAVLNLRISITDRTTVVRILTQGIAQEKSQAAIAEDLIAALRPKVIEVQLPLDYFKQITQHASKNDLGVFVLMRDGLFYELGLRYPDIRLMTTENLKPSSFRFRINHLTTLPWVGLQLDECMVNESSDRLRILYDISDDTQVQSATNPANRNLCSVIDVKDKPAEAANLTTWTQTGYVALALNGELRTHANCFLDCEGFRAELGKLEPNFPKLVTVAQAQIPLERMTQTLRLLLAEEISIRNLRHILQAMLDYDFIVTDGSKYIIFDPRLTANREPSEDWLKDPVNLTAFVRITMKRYISQKYTRGQSTLSVYLLESEIEDLLTNHQAVAAKQHYAQLTTQDRDRILEAVRNEIDNVSHSNSTIPAVLTLTDVRHALQALIAPEFPYLPVLAYRELSPDMNIQPIARISLGN